VDGYSEGLFPSQRMHRYLRYAVEDDTIFPTAVIVYTLQQVRNDLAPPARHQVDTMVRKAVANYPRYLNNQGYPIYNFWQNVPVARFFPNGTLLRRFRLFHLPEDIDTTAYIYLTRPHDRREVAWLKERLILDANGQRRRIRNTLAPYRSLPAYSTWLGEANMPIDFDVCALSNLLLFIVAHDLPLNAHDQASIRFITSVIEQDHHLTHPFEVAPWYGNTAVILYHVARLAASCEIPALVACKDKLLHHLRAQAARTTCRMERLLLSTSCMRLGEPPLVARIPEDMDAAFDGFFFFIGSLLTAIDNPMTWMLARHPLFHVRYRCRAHALAIVLEHEIWRRRLG
jgi:hypothetical protein